MVIFNLKFSMVNSNSVLNECESECESKPESEFAPANLNINSVSSTYSYYAAWVFVSTARNLETIVFGEVTIRLFYFLVSEKCL